MKKSRVRLEKAPLKTSVLPAFYRSRARILVKSGAVMSHLTRLELLSISVPTLIDYTARLLFFVNWCMMMGVDWMDSAQLDIHLVEFFDELFWMLAPDRINRKLDDNIVLNEPVNLCV